MDYNVYKEGREPYTFVIETGCENPEKNHTEKLKKGTLILEINNGSKSSSGLLLVKKNFSVMTESSVKADFWLPEKVGPPLLLNVNLEGHFLRRQLRLSHFLYIRRISVIYKLREYTFPVRNFLSASSGKSTDKNGNNLAYLTVREGGGRVRELECNSECMEFLVKAREEDLAMVKKMVEWNTPDDSRPHFISPGHIHIKKYKQLPQFLKFLEAKYEKFESLNKWILKIILKHILETISSKICCRFTGGRFEHFKECEPYFLKMSEEVKLYKEPVFDVRNAMAMPQYHDKCDDDVINAMAMHQYHDEYDEEFVRGILCGPNASKIRAVKPEDGSCRWKERSTQLQDHHILVGENKTFEDALKEKLFFEVTYSELLDGVEHENSHSILLRMLMKTRDTWYVVLADCLLYLKKDGKLVPILIRLENRNDKQDETWWTPPHPDPDPTIPDIDHQHKLQWIYAKMWLRCAEVSCEVIGTHFGRSHALNEVFAIAAYRNLSSAHPIFRLLKPHLHGIVAVNVKARKSLVNSGNNALTNIMATGRNVDKVLDNYYRKLSYEDLVLDRDVKNRGVENLPGYFYRDDILGHWEILHQYVDEMVELAYSSDSSDVANNITNDVELQEFFHDVAVNGLKGFEDHAGFPEKGKVDNRKKLTEYLTAVIANNSVFHAAASMQQFNFYSSPLITPSCMSQPPPKQDEEITEEHILNSIPTKPISLIAMTLLYSLQQASPIETYFLETPGGMGPHTITGLGGAKQKDCLHDMVRKMRALENKINDRNDKEENSKYDVLCPSKVPVCTDT